MTETPAEPDPYSSSRVHIPVLTEEIMRLGIPLPGETWVDGTAGAGGHARRIAEAIGPNGRLLAIDRDPEAVRHLQATAGENTQVVHDSYANTLYLIQSLGWQSANGVLLDLGLSSDQLADRERGFSFQTDGELDMRFDPTSGEPAWEWLRRVDERELADAIYQYGEERFSRRIAKRIVERRKTEAIRTASELRELIYGCIPRPRRDHRGARRHGRVDPATRTFQALRIVVNDELQILERALASLPDCLDAGGKIMVISFHSLEDRITKHAFRNDERLEVITKKPVQATEAEIARNPRSRSAKLRIARRVTSFSP